MEKSSSSEVEEITINVKTIVAKDFQIKVPTDILVSELKKRISESQNIPEEKQRLIYQGKVLRDEKTIKFYSIKDLHTIHMVAKQPQAPNVPETPSQAPSQPSGNPFGSSQSNIVVGSITLPEGNAPDLSQILGNVFSTLIGSGPGQNSQIVIGQNEITQILTALQSRVSSLQNVSTPISTSSSSSSFGPIGTNLQQTHSVLSNLMPFVQNLAQTLQNEPSIVETSSRSQSQQLTNSMSSIFQQLSLLFGGLASSLQSVQFGAQPVQAQVSSQNVSSNSSSTPVNLPQNAQNLQVPFVTISQRSASPSASTVPSTTTPSAPASAPNSLAPLFSALTNMLGGNQQPNQAQNTASGSAPQNGNPLQSIMQMMAPLLQGVQQPANSSSSTTTQPPQSGAEIAQLFGTLNQLSNQNINRATQSSSSNSSSSDSSNFPINDPNLNVNLNNNINPVPPSSSAAVMSQTFNAVNQAITGMQPHTMSSVIGTIAQGMNMTSNSEEGVFGDILQKVMDSLTIPDMLSIMSGNWEPLERVHPILKTYLEGILKGDKSLSRLERISDDMIDTMKSSINEKKLPDDIRKRVRSGYEVSTLSLQVMRKHTTKLLQVILSPIYAPPDSSSSSSSSSTTGTTPASQTRVTGTQPFAVLLRQWTVKFVEELVTALSQACHDGVPDAAVVIKHFWGERLAVLGLGPEFTSMGTNMVTSYIMNTYASSQAAVQANEDPATWNNAIAVDEIRQSSNAPQRPLSDSYTSGGPSKKRKSAIETNPQTLMQSRLRDALSGSQLSSVEAEDLLQTFPAEQLAHKYTQQLKEDVARRLESDPDYDPSEPKNKITSEVFGRKK